MKPTGEKFFGAFIITYNRLDFLPSTVQKIWEQTMPPEVIVIIDNSTNSETKNWVLQQNNPQLQYHAVGYNSGPAGGAATGLQVLANMGYQWIYWGDDNDPPQNSEVFERLMNITKLPQYQATKIGGVGGKGGHFFGNKVRTQNLANKLLQANQREVDYITGGQQFIINASVIKHHHCLPDEGLFFSFEDLDFCLKVKQAGYTLLVDTEAWLLGRGTTGQNPNFRWQGSNFGTSNVLWRQYYSIRNLLYILRTNGHYLGVIYLIGKEISKAPFAFKFGFKYGKNYTRVVFTAIIHFIAAKKGAVPQFTATLN